MTCRICEKPVYFPHTCECDGIVHKECLQEECEECEQHPQGRKPWCVYILAVLFAICQSLIDNIPMQILPRILIVLLFSCFYILFSWCAHNLKYGDKAALLPTACMVAYVLVSVCFLHFAWFTILQIYILAVYIFITFSIFKP